MINQILYVDEDFDVYQNNKNTLLNLVSKVIIFDYPSN